MGIVENEDVSHGVDLALRSAYTRSEQTGRNLHPIETRWVVRAAFRARFIGLTPTLANRYADQMITIIQACA